MHTSAFRDDKLVPRPPWTNADLLRRGDTSGHMFFVEAGGGAEERAGSSTIVEKAALLGGQLGAAVGVPCAVALAPHPAPTRPPLKINDMSASVLMRGLLLTVLGSRSVFHD